MADTNKTTNTPDLGDKPELGNGKDGSGSYQMRVGFGTIAMLISATGMGLVPLRPGLIINNPHRKLPEEQRAIFEANDWQIVEAAQPAHDEPPALCYSSVWLSMNCLVLDPKTVIVEASEVHQQEQMDKLGMNVIPCDLRDAYPFGGGLHCSTADVYREGDCLDYFPNRVKDPTLVRPEMWND